MCGETASEIIHEALCTVSASSTQEAGSSRPGPYVPPGASESESHRFQPAGRFSAANSR